MTAIQYEALRVYDKLSKKQKDKINELALNSIHAGVKCNPFKLINRVLNKKKHDIFEVRKTQTLKLDTEIVRFLQQDNIEIQLSKLWYNDCY